MKNLSLTIALLFVMSLSGQLYAQEYKISVSGSKTLKIYDVNKVAIEGHSGSEIIFSTESKSNSQSERAEGLQAISAMGLVDNSGIGLSVVENGDVIEVNPMSKRSSPRFTIKVPSNVKIYYEHSTSHGSKLTIKDVSSELEISTNHNSVLLENVTGPLTVNTVHGKIEATFTSVSQSNPISIMSVHGLVDVALPSATKADLSLKSSWGEIFTDMKIEFENDEENLRKVTSTNIRGKLNGGGVNMTLASTHNNVYLRTRK